MFGRLSFHLFWYYSTHPRISSPPLVHVSLFLAIWPAALHLFRVVVSMTFVSTVLLLMPSTVHSLVIWHAFKKFGLFCIRVAVFRPYTICFPSFHLLVLYDSLKCKRGCQTPRHPSEIIYSSPDLQVWFSYFDFVPRYTYRFILGPIS